MHQGIIHLHSGLRYVVIILLIATLFKAFSGISSKREFTNGDRKLALFTMISLHIQLLIGIGLYLTSTMVHDAMMADNMMGVTLHRFWGGEHAAGMVLAIILITIGHARAKRATDSTRKFKRIAWSYLIGTLIILASIPWPFRGLGAGWF